VVWAEAGVDMAGSVPRVASGRRGRFVGLRG
jgi:hypothetical protein